jgi:hypothetical protein
MKNLIMLSVFVILLALSSTTRGNDRMKIGAIRTQKEYTMEMVLIDTFIVPEETKAGEHHFLLSLSPSTMLIVNP